MLIRGDRPLEQRDALRRRSGVEEHGIRRIRQGGIKIAAPVRDVVQAGDRGDTVRVAADEQQAWQHAAGINEETTLLDDRDQRVGEMLGRADAAGRAVDDDADRLRGHRPLVRRMG